VNLRAEVSATSFAEAVCRVIMRDPTRDPELRFAAAHVALVLEHAEAYERVVLDANAQLELARRADRG
jgi:hypothetical protein